MLRVWSGFKILFLIVAIVFLPGAKVYKWVDENGKKHFSSVPPNSSQSEVNEYRFNSGESEPVALGPIFENTWYASNKGNLIEFTPGKKRYSWTVHTRNFSKKIKSGEWAFESGTLVLRSTSEVNNYRVSGVSKYRMTFTDLKHNNRYVFVRNKEPRSSLSRTEKKIEGIWTELDSYGNPIARVEFYSGLFSRYYLSHGTQSISTRYNDRNLISEGSWRISSSNFIMSYAQSYGNMARKTATEESWVIKKITNNEMLFVSGGRKLLRFKR